MLKEVGQGVLVVIVTLLLLVILAWVVGVGEADASCIVQILDKTLENGTEGRMRVRLVQQTKPTNRVTFDVVWDPTHAEVLGDGDITAWKCYSTRVNATRSHFDCRSRDGSEKTGTFRIGDIRVRARGGAGVSLVQPTAFSADIKTDCVSDAGFLTVAGQSLPAAKLGEK